MKILVTGGSGYLGTHVQRFFDADDMSRRSGKDILVTPDLADISGYDVVIHLAALLDKRPDAADEVFETNVQGTVNVLRAMKKDGVFIFASTKDVYGRFADNHSLVGEDCSTTYAGQSALEWSKLIAERYVDYHANALGIRSCIFRLSTVYAPKTDGNTPSFVGHYADAINTGERLTLPAAGTPKRDIMHVDDFSSACQAFIDSIIGHGTYNLGGGPQNALTLKDLVSKMEEVSGLEAVMNEEPEFPPPVPLNYVTDLRLVSQELGWKPKVGIEEGLRTLF